MTATTADERMRKITWGGHGEGEVRESVSMGRCGGDATRGEGWGEVR